MPTWRIHCALNHPGCDRSWYVEIERDDLAEDAPPPQNIVIGYCCPSCDLYRAEHPEGA